MSTNVPRFKKAGQTSRNQWPVEPLQDLPLCWNPLRLNYGFTLGNAGLPASFIPQDMFPNPLLPPYIGAIGLLFAWSQILQKLQR